MTLPNLKPIREYDDDMNTEGDVDEHAPEQDQKQAGSHITAATTNQGTSVAHPVT